VATDHVNGQLKRLPASPGVYLFRGERDEVLYVGKAKSLRKRTASYLTRDLEPRLATMVSEAVDLETVITDSEAEALLLENNWIKTIPGQGWFAMFRLYGPLEPTFDGTWKLNNIESTN